MTENERAREAVVAALERVVEPQSGRSVVALGIVKTAAVCDGVVRVVYQLAPNNAAPETQTALRSGTLEVLRALDGIRSVDVEFAVVQPPTHSLPGVKNVIAVGAGKGGVGKSTVAVLLACGLQKQGYKVGLLDADVYGPSLPKLTGTEGHTPQQDADGRIVPPQRNGIPIMSMGYLVPSNQAIVWRGPMAQKYVSEFLNRGAWGELDYLIVDLPPGTGDIPLTLSQTIPLTGAVVVCTPQDLALLDATKAVLMYQKLNVEVLGMVENMSYYLCPQCGHRAEIFSHGGCEEAARGLGLPFLGSVPLHLSIRVNSDAGEPFESFSKADPLIIDALTGVTARLVEEVERHLRERLPLPQIRMRG